MIPKSTPFAANCFPVRTTVTLCDDLGEPLSEPDYITDALCVIYNAASRNCFINEKIVPAPLTQGLDFFPDSSPVVPASAFFV